MKAVGTENLVVGEKYITSTNHYLGSRLFVFKWNNNFIHPSDPNLCYAKWIYVGSLFHKETFVILELTKMQTDSSNKPGRYARIKTASDPMGWMWLDETETFYQLNDTLQVGKLYTAANQKLPKDCQLMKQVVRAHPANNSHKVSIDCWQDCFVLLGYNNDHRWINVLTSTGHTGWARNNVELKLVDQLT